MENAGDITCVFLCCILRFCTKKLYFELSVHKRKNGSGRLKLTFIVL